VSSRREAPALATELLPILRTRDSAFAYTCHACNRCCRGRGIRVNPYELIRLAVGLGLSTTATRHNWLDVGGFFLGQRKDGRCRFLGEAGCTVHADRPLACRLYPPSHDADDVGSDDPNCDAADAAQWVLDPDPVISA
jgi:Fe-S-cluster containining protein